ncbi:hypothetical protein RB195_019738 [Necator americanus]|uniref:Carbohydrate sulfotransferase n=1 Tax=Necator americanus TaxID=51031 RepID=A0ABR1CHT3_NECAM
MVNFSHDRCEDPSELPLRIPSDFAAEHPVTLNPQLRSCLMKKKLLPPFVKFKQRYVVAPEYKLGNCLIEKVMSTFQVRLFCYLNKPWLFGKGKKGITGGRWEDRLCKEGSFRKASKGTVLRSLGNDPIFFIVTRNPLQRFVSAFMQLCMNDEKIYCSDGGRDISCFLPRLRDLLFSYYHNPKKKYSTEGPLQMSHFAPMTWYCSSFPFLKFVRVIRHDILQREEMAKTYDSLFKIAGVPMQQRSYIRSELTGGLPPHATWNKADRIDIQNELLSNNTLLEIFLQLYYHDFVIFGYDFPTPRYTQ